MYGKVCTNILRPPLCVVVRHPVNLLPFCHHRCRCTVNRHSIRAQKERDPIHKMGLLLPVRACLPARPLPHCLPSMCECECVCCAGEWASEFIICTRSVSAISQHHHHHQPTVSHSVFVCMYVLMLRHTGRKMPVARIKPKCARQPGVFFAVCVFVCVCCNATDTNTHRHATHSTRVAQRRAISLISTPSKEYALGARSRKVVKQVLAIQNETKRRQRQRQRVATTTTKTTAVRCGARANECASARLLQSSGLHCCEDTLCATRTRPNNQRAQCCK